MGLASLLFQNTYNTEFRTSGNKDAFLVVDVVIQETHTLNSTITAREVEEGVDITDHISNAPISVVINGIISENPLTLASAVVGASVGLASKYVSNVTGFTAASTAVIGAAGGVLGGLVNTKIGGSMMGTKNGNRAQNFYKILQEIHEKKIIFDFVTGLESYTSMALQSLSINKTKELGKDISFTATLQKVRIVSSQTVAINESLIAQPAAASAATSSDLGKQSTKAVDKNGGIAWTLKETAQGR